MQALTTDMAGLLAKADARDAHENEFPSRRGMWRYTDDPELVALYNSDLYPADPTARERERERIRARLNAEGIEELAYATYPESAGDAGYTYVMILRADERQQERLGEIVVEETLRTGRDPVPVGAKPEPRDPQRLGGSGAAKGK
jgi:hypothetical protein